MANKWGSLLFETCLAGASSAVMPELLPETQVAWAKNVDMRGGKPRTRSSWRWCMDLPDGFFQGAGYFSVQDGMIVASIAGEIYRLRIGSLITDFVWQPITLEWRNSAKEKQAWFCQTVESLIIQDGQSAPIVYDGSTAKRMGGRIEVPRGRQMAYGNGRLWVAINANELVAGDIRQSAPGSELKFTETTYLYGGGSLSFQEPITGLKFIPTNGLADYGALLVFSGDGVKAVRADVTSRDQWQSIPAFVTDVLRQSGSSGQWSICEVNQDLFWRDSLGGIRSMQSSIVDESGSGVAPISGEISRITDHEGVAELKFCSMVNFDNRLLITASPFLNSHGGVSFKHIAALDFAPLSSMQGKSAAAWCGQWEGLSIRQLVSGKFGGRDRAFAIVTTDDGVNQLWEVDKRGRADGIRPVRGMELTEHRTTCVVEYPLRNFGEAKRMKRLERCDVWLADMDGAVDMEVYWRADNSEKWRKWDDTSVCAKTNDASTNYPHVWKNLQNQQRLQIKTFWIPYQVDEISKRAAHVGFSFQIRIVWTGHCRINRVMLHASLLDDPDYANKGEDDSVCVEQDVTGNEITYTIPTGG